MTCTLVAQVVDDLGHACWEWRGAYGGRHVDHVAATPADSFDLEQPARIPVTAGHGGVVLGHVGYLERDGGITAVAVLPGVDVDQVDGFYASADLHAEYPYNSHVAERCRLVGLALVEQTAGVGARPVQVWKGDLGEVGFEHRSLSSGPTLLLRRAGEHIKRSRWERRSTTRIATVEERVANFGLATSTTVLNGEQHDYFPHGRAPVEHWPASASRILRVS